MLPIILFDDGDASFWRMVDNFIPYVMNVCDHNVHHGFCCRCVKDLHDIIVAVQGSFPLGGPCSIMIIVHILHMHVDDVGVQDDRSLGRPCSYSSYACW